MFVLDFVKYYYNNHRQRENDCMPKEKVCDGRDYLGKRHHLGDHDEEHDLCQEDSR
jgi:hypothetical protein